MVDHHTRQNDEDHTKNGGHRHPAEHNPRHATHDRPDPPRPTTAARRPYVHEYGSLGATHKSIKTHNVKPRRTDVRKGASPWRDE